MPEYRTPPRMNIKYARCPEAPTLDANAEPEKKTAKQGNQNSSPPATAAQPPGTLMRKHIAKLSHLSTLFNVAFEAAILERHARLAKVRTA